jgi:Protein of unknown function (DUF2971)
MDIPPFILHHYTSGQGLLGVFENSEIWASSIHQLNDTREFAHAVDLGRASLIARAAAIGGPRIDEIVEAVAWHLDSICNFSIYVACFSEVEDSLSQWRGYCPSGFGYSIGFDGERLRAVAQLQGFRLDRCIYDHDSQKRAADTWAHRTLSQLLPSTANVDDFSLYVQNNCTAFLEDFVVFSPFLKNSSFKDEREWRLVGVVPFNDPRMRLRVGRSMLVRYLPIKLPLNRHSPLVWNIRVGPTPHPKLAVNSISHFFHKIRIQSSISPSSIPYRDW